MRRIFTAAVSYHAYFLLPLCVVCNSGQLSDNFVDACLTRTDTPEFQTTQRSSIAWLIDYEHKVKDTRCCALEPRTSVLAKRHDLKRLQSELLNRIDKLEMGSDAPARAKLSRDDRCYRALMDLYHDVMYARGAAR